MESSDIHALTNCFGPLCLRIMSCDTSISLEHNFVFGFSTSKATSRQCTCEFPEDGMTAPRERSGWNSRLLTLHSLGREATNKEVHSKNKFINFHIHQL